MTLAEAMEIYPNTYVCLVAKIDAKFGPFYTEEAAQRWGERMASLNPGLTYEVKPYGFIAPQGTIG